MAITIGQLLLINTITIGKHIQLTLMKLLFSDVIVHLHISQVTPRIMENSIVDLPVNIDLLYLTNWKYPQFQVL
jgi:hypothetical protein